MQLIKLIKKLKELDLEIFTINDIIKITKQDKNTVRHFLSRNVKNKNMYRLKKGHYSIDRIENKFKIGNVYNNTYIGLNSALEYYQTTNQRFNSLDLISIKNNKNTQINGTKIFFHKIKKELFFGFKKIMINNTTAFISNIEKTIIDCVLFSNKVYLSEIIEFIRIQKENIDLVMLNNYLVKINSSILNKRIGYLLELNNLYISLSINNKYEKLNKNLLSKGKKDYNWKLIINEELLWIEMN